MATGKRKTSSRGRKPVKRNTGSRSKKRADNSYALMQTIKVVIIAAIALFVFVCNFNVAGKVGSTISDVLFGLFGVLNYIVSIVIASLIIYSMLRGHGSRAVRKVVSAFVLFLMASMIADIVSGISKTLSKYDAKAIYMHAYTDHQGGGFFAGSLVYVLMKYLGAAGTWIFIIAFILICIILLTEGAVISSVKETSRTVMEHSAENRELKKVYNAEQRDRYEQKRLENRERREKERLEHENRRIEAEERRRLKEQEHKSRREALKQAKEDEEVLRKNRKVKGITLDTDLSSNLPFESKAPGVVDLSDSNDDVHEIMLNGFNPGRLEFTGSEIVEEEPLSINGAYDDEPVAYLEEEDVIIPAMVTNKTVEKPSSPVTKKSVDKANESMDMNEIKNEISMKPEKEQVYEFPPRSLLVKGSKKAGDSAASIRQTAEKLEKTLAIFGVEASVTDVSQGPTVTRFELQPKLGVKVSKIKNLSDDIKLNLAASEIRIEAPIPGKAAIGIEVPNKEAQPVLFRDLIDTPEYNDFNSNLAFAVGKDIAGKTIVYGIDSFPHLLIAGATGAGKSVCINSLIMSIIYKASPDDVKLIMIDPKVVELSVYNDIPHLLLPVVTNVKKAAATLQYAVNNMQERYKLFAEMGVRDINGYNRVVSENPEDSFHTKLPRIVIIVDEMAELMLQEKKSVEEAICSLAQLARAAGIHLVIATQRPSVDVITGLIKANMPSRIAFSVSSNVDSRTILDMGGAEELLGKGDMLFFPKGLKKPVRLQGAFISDKEVSDVVEFLKNHGKPSYDEKIQEQIETTALKSESGGSGSSSGMTGEDGGDGTDELFADAGFLIIDSQKASIGMLQRKFRIGFNRAARIMDQLADAQVVGPEVGTKPRDILMSRESFENYLEQN